MVIIEKQKNLLGNSNLRLRGSLPSSFHVAQHDLKTSPNIISSYRTPQSTSFPARIILSKSQLGFTLIELMVTIGIVAILAGVAVPNYISFTKNSEVSEALTTLINLSTQMEKRFVDVRNYGTGDECGIDSPTGTYTFSCVSDGQTYTWTATAPDDEYIYTIDNTGARKTTKFDGDSTEVNCWTVSTDGSCY